MKNSRPTIVIIGISILTVLIIWFGISTRQFLRNEARNLEVSIDKAISYIGGRDWKSVQSTLDDIENKWLGIKSTWSVLIDHQEIDNIDIALVRLKSLAKAKEAPDALSEASALKTFVGHIPEKEKLKLENLF